MPTGTSSSPVLRVRPRPSPRPSDLLTGWPAVAARRSGRASGTPLGVGDDIFARLAEVDRKLDIAVSQLEVCVAGVDLLKRHHLHGELPRLGSSASSGVHLASCADGDRGHLGALLRQAPEAASAKTIEEGEEPSAAGPALAREARADSPAAGRGPAWAEDLGAPASGLLRASRAASEGGSAGAAPCEDGSEGARRTPPRSPCPLLIFSGTKTSLPVLPGATAGEDPVKESQHAIMSVGFGLSPSPGGDLSGSDSACSSKRSSDLKEVTRRARPMHSPDFLRATVAGYGDTEDGTGSWRPRIFQWWGTVWALFVVCSVLFPLAGTLEPRPLPPVVAAAVETAIEAVFAIELTVRLVASQGKRGFIRNPFNVIDLLSVLPIVLRALLGFVLPERLDADEVPEVVLICVVPVLRLAKVLRRDFVQIKLFERVFSSTMETMQFLALVGGIIVLTFAFLVFVTEPRDNVDTYWRALYFVIVTMSTVGYGDVSPVTDEGHVVISVLIMSSILFMAIPVGVLGNAFAFAWSDRDLIMLIEQTRQQISGWGYQPTDLPKFFLLFDADNDGELNFDEFLNMMSALTINLNGDRMVNLFQLFDRDNGGTIDQMEFLRAVYPHAFHQILNEEKAEKERKEKEEKEQRRRMKKERQERQRKLRAEKQSTAEEQTRGSLTSPGLMSPRPGSDDWPGLASPRPGSVD